MVYILTYIREGIEKQQLWTTHFYYTNSNINNGIGVNNDNKTK